MLKGTCDIQRRVAAFGLAVADGAETREGRGDQGDRGRRGEEFQAHEMPGR